ncbi:MAG: hypothetical protein GVY25_07450 [Bacteroidetes bacterium]|jgi:tetratricopeptide (TPR) repeat protein|nr:hypothetical protein [Bacteroidota bacterium]
MKKAVTLFSIILAAALTLTGCDLLDSRNVTNPDVTEEAALANPNPLRAWIGGLERQLAITKNNTVLVAELATDNYINTQTFFNQAFDSQTFDYRDTDIDDGLFTMNDLRESAIFGKESVLPADPEARPDDIAELDFFLGYAHIMLGEYFEDAPLTGGADAATPTDHFNEAVTALEAAIESGDGDPVSYNLALARAQYNLGNIGAAREAANAALAADDDYVRFVQYDFNNDPTNTMQDGVYDRATFDDLQPLPRLDFLDPKYANLGAGDEETFIPFIKAEEAHLILIEAFLAEDNLSNAQDQMLELIDLVDARPVRDVDESFEGRTQDDPGSRPDNSGVVVRASPDDDFRSGLVLDRTEATPSPSISGTSVTAAIVNNIANTDEAWEILYLMRQEIFLGEGRRFVDFGIKYPLSQTEVQVNENFDESGSIIEPSIPSYIDGQPLDAFTYDADAGEATIEVNMNAVLSSNRAAVSPFLQ